MLAIARRKLIRPLGLAFPGTKPGFDPSHFAAAWCRAGHGFSGVATGGFLNLLTGAQGTKNSTPTPAIVSPIGPAQLFNGGTTSYTFAGQSIVNDLAFSAAAIVQFTAVAGNSALFCSSSAASTGFDFSVVSTTSIGVDFPGGGNTLGVTVPTLANGVPYFMGVSAVQNGANFNLNAVLLNMLTGVVASGSASGASTGPVAPNGTYMVGNTPAGFHHANGNIAAVAFVPSFLSLAVLQKWAADPWSFWYPR